MFLIVSTGSVVSLVAFGVYASQGNEMTASIIFPSLVLINSLYWPLLILPEVISYFVEYRTALRRLLQFFNETPISSYTNDKLPPARLDATNALDMRSATFAWPPPPAIYATDMDDGLEDDAGDGEPRKLSDDERRAAFEEKKRENERAARLLIDQPVLNDISLSVPRGSLLAVVGPVGCGKYVAGVCRPCASAQFHSRVAPRLLELRWSTLC